MSVERISLDANILFYTVDADAGARQTRRARSQAGRGVLGLAGGTMTGENGS